jgi:two-component system, OmpR family, sensor kinase
MDGFKRRLSESVQFKLSLALSLAILIIALVGGTFSFISAFDEAHELQDDVLRQVASLMSRQPLSSGRLEGGALSKESDEEARVIVQRLGDVGDPAIGVDAGGLLPLPETLPDGLQTLEADGETFRVMVASTSDGSRIAVAQEAGLRDEIARDSALRTVMPFLILVPVLLLVVADIVRKSFRPIATLSKEIDQRAAQNLHPVDEGHLPIEVRPFGAAINRLLARVSRSMEDQRRFVADAAHELRSPLTALSLQAERLAEADMSGTACERLEKLRHGIDRGRLLLDQLLALARAQSSQVEQMEQVSIQAVFRRVLEDLLPMAEAKNIDIGVEGDQDPLVQGCLLDLITLVRNLADNAIRYTPEGGKVDLFATMEPGVIVIRVRDNGPGIPILERERVFAPFHRVLGNGQTGSGLGLSIVQAIAERLGAEVGLEYGDEIKQQGLCVRVRIPSGKDCF